MRHALREMYLQEKKGKEGKVHLAVEMYSLFPEIGNKSEPSHQRRYAAFMSCRQRGLQELGGGRRHRPTWARQTSGQARDEAFRHIASLAGQEGQGHCEKDVSKGAGAGMCMMCSRDNESSPRLSLQLPHNSGHITGYYFVLFS